MHESVRITSVFVLNEMSDAIQDFALTSCLRFWQEKDRH